MNLDKSLGLDLLNLDKFIGLSSLRDENSWVELIESGQVP